MASLKNESKKAKKCTESAPSTQKNKNKEDKSKLENMKSITITLDSSTGILLTEETENEIKPRGLSVSNKILSDDEYEDISGAQPLPPGEDEIQKMIDNEANQPTSTESDASQDIFQDGQPLLTESEELGLEEIEVITNTGTCTHLGKCSQHEHIEDGVRVECNGLPWGRITLAEYDMTRKKLMIKKFKECFKANPNFSLHYAILAFQQSGLEITKPIVKKESLSLVFKLLGKRPDFSYRCMTNCDMELLRQTILTYFGVKSCPCPHGLINLSQNLDEDVDDSFLTDIKLNLRVLVQDCYENFFGKFNSTF